MKVGYITTEDFVNGDFKSKVKPIPVSTADVELDYMDRSVLRKDVEESYEIEVLEENSSHILAYDESWGREVQFNYLDTLDVNNLFEFNSLKIKKEKFFSLVNLLDKTLFMTVKKIVFLNNKKEYNKLVKELDNYEFMDDLQKELGKHLFYESVVIVNMMAIKKTIKDMIKESDYYINEWEEIHIALFTTLIHELRHSYQANPLYEEEFSLLSRDGIEDDAEDYCRRIFEDVIEKENFYVLE